MSEKKSIVDQDLIRQLAALLDETGLTEIEVEHDDTRIRVARGGAAATASPAPAPPPPPSPPAKTEAAPAPPTPPSDLTTHAGAVLSPMVGTAYMAPEPGGRPYVEVGDTVSEGQTLLIVEAMKTMNQIPAPRAGTVIRIMVEDGHPVEFGEPLMIIE
jgi:acetyl-CoA carboxylase biotin carboxyl carrier protein